MAPREMRCEIVALDEFHHQRAHAAGFFKPMDVGNVGMVQGRQRLRFARESCEPVRIVGERIREGFERDIAIQLRVASPVYQTHSALANLCGDFVDAEARADGEAQAVLVE